MLTGRLSEASLQPQAEGWREILERITDAFFALDRNWCFTYMNKNAGIIAGREPADMVGKNIWTEFPEGLNHSFHTACETALADQRYISEEVFYKPFNRWFEVHIYPSALGLSLYFRDITERKKTEREIKESEEKYRSLFDHSMDAIMLTSPDGRILKANAAACSMLGMTEEEICRAGRNGIVDVSDPQLPFLLQERESTGKVKSEVKLIRKSGEKFPAEITSTVYTDSSGEKRTSMIIRDMTLRLKAVEALRESEEKYRDLVENMNELICIHDLEGNILSINPSTVKHLGYPHDKIMKMNLRQFLVPENRHLFDDYLAEIARNGQSKGLMLVQNSAGEKRVWEYYNTLRTTGVGKPVIRGMARDITEKKKAEKELAESENRLRTILNTNPKCIKILNEKGEIQYINPAGLALIQADNPEMVMGKSVTGILVPGYRNAFLSLIKQVFSGESCNMEFEIEGLKGTRRWMETHAVPFRDPSGKIISLLAVTRDITELKKKSGELSASEEQFRALYEENPLMNFTVDVNGNILSVNRRGASELGYTPHELTGKSLLQLFMPEDHGTVLDYLKECTVHPKKSVTRTLRKVTRSGEIIQVSETGTALPDQNGHYIIMIVCENITERKKAEEQIRINNIQLRQLASHLVSIREEERKRISLEIHDELGQYLTALKLNVSRLGAAKAAGTKPDEFAEILAQLDHCLDIVRNISYELRPHILDDIGLMEAIEWYTSEFEKRTGISAKFNSAYPEIIIPSDQATGLFRIFQESLTNVVRHAKAGQVRGEIKIAGGKLVMTVKDDGIGFDKTLNEGASSLGLLGMKERALLMNGDLEIDTSPGHGTTVKVTIPFSAEPASPVRSRKG